MELSPVVDDDEDVRSALAWLADVSGDPAAFDLRLRAAQLAYARYTAEPANLGGDSSLRALGPDVVAAFLAQSKSMLDDRRSYDIALSSRCIPWVKQLGVNIAQLAKVPGARERARRMLEDRATEPDGPMLELVMAGNYAADGADVALVPEQVGRAKTPDLHLTFEYHPDPVAIEFKRLREGAYEADERQQQRRIFRKAEEIIHRERLSLHVDVNYSRELKDVPDGYLAGWLQRFLTSPLITLRGYPWHDEFGSGEIRPANVDAVLEDIRDTSLYFGTKLARLLSGAPVRENGYQLAAGLLPDERDPRYFKRFRYGSVITWQCTAPAAIERKTRHVKSKLIEASQQVATQEVGVIHLAMDMELECEASDLRRERNKQVIREFKVENVVAALYVHYLVPRISELNTWIIDETVDRFGAGVDAVPSSMIFPGSAELGNDVPAWRQSIPLPPRR